MQAGRPATATRSAPMTRFAVTTLIIAVYTGCRMRRYGPPVASAVSPVPVTLVRQAGPSASCAVIARRTLVQVVNSEVFPFAATTYRLTGAGVSFVPRRRPHRRREFNPGRAGAKTRASKMTGSNR